MLWLSANFRTGFQKEKFGEKPGAFDLLNAKFSSVSMNYNSHINMNHNGLFEVFRGQNVLYIDRIL